MKTLKTIMLSAGTLSLLVTTAAVMANERSIDQTLDVNGEGKVRLKIVDGDVEFKTWKEQQVRVVGTLGDDDKELVFYNDDNDTIIKIETDKGYYERSHRSWSDDETALQVYMPANMHLFAQSTSGNFDIEGIKANLKAKSVSGDIDISNSEGSIAAYTSSGDIELENCKGEVHIESVSGDIEASVDSQRFEVSTISGDLTARLGEVERVEVDTVSGDMELELKLMKDGSIQGSTVSGDIELFFDQKTISAHFDLHTGPGGDIDNNLTDDKPKESWVKSESIEFKSGKGTGVVELETVSGSLEVSKK